MNDELPLFHPEPSDQPAPALRSLRGDLPLRAVAVKAHVVGATASVVVEQTYENPYDETVEVSYVFPLPDLAAVTGCELHLGDRVITAALKERGAAREDFAAAVAEGKSAALAEQERPGVFTLTLGNLQPAARATVRFALAFPLPREDGRHTLRFPLVVGERYVAGMALDGLQTGHGVQRDTDLVPDASRVSPPRLAPGASSPELAIEVVLAHGELGVFEMESSLHAVTTASTAEAMTVTLRPGQAMDCDFVLRFRLGDDQLRTQLCLVPDATGDQGTFQLTVLPPAAPVKARPRDVVVVLDRSGSMDGWKIVAARRALARLLDGLDAHDRLAAFAFGSELIAPEDLAYDRLHAATPRTRARAAAFLGGIVAEGGTELLHPLQHAMALLGDRDPTRDRWLVLVTDGQVAGEDALVAAPAPPMRVLALGIDEAVNGSLLSRLVRQSGGHLELVQKHSELEDALDRLHLRIGSPALERVTVRGADGLELVADTLVPQGPLHAFPGTPLVVRGRYRGSAGSVQVRGQGHSEPFSRNVRGRVEPLPALRACWAREQLLALEDEFAATPHGRDALAARVVETSLKYGVLCRFTALVAVDERGPTAIPAERHVQQPVASARPVPVPEPAPVAGPRLPSPGSAPQGRYGGQSLSQRASKTQAGILKGKLSYLSPEQVRGLPLDPRHEVFLLGMIFGEFITNERFYVGESDFSVLEMIRDAVIKEEWFPPARAWLQPLVRHALARDVGDRIQSPGAFADALEALGQPIATRAELAAWVQSVAPSRHRDRDLGLVAAAQPPPGGYVLLRALGTGLEGDTFLAARASAAGNEAVHFKRLRTEFAEDEELLQLFVCEATLPVDGLVRTLEVGTDSRGGVFRAQAYVDGPDLRELFEIHRRARRPVPLEMALAIFVQAARALEAGLHLQDPAYGPVGLILRDMTPYRLKVGFDGTVVWLKLGAAPTARFAAPQRSQVPLSVAPTVQQPSRHGASTLHVHGKPAPDLPRSRYVVVPRPSRVQTVHVSAGPPPRPSNPPPPPPPEPFIVKNPPPPAPPVQPTTLPPSLAEKPVQPPGLATRLTQWWKGK